MIDTAACMLAPRVEGIASFLCLGGAGSAFCSLGDVVMACQLLLPMCLLLTMLTGLTESACSAMLVLLQTKSTWFLSVLPLLLCGSGMQTPSHLTLILCGAAQVFESFLLCQPRLSTFHEDMTLLPWLANLSILLAGRSL